MAIELNISGNTSSAVSAIDNVNKSLDKVPASAAKAEQGLSRVPAAFNSVNSSAKSLPPAIYGVTNAFESINGLNFDDKLKDALDRVNASIDKNVADALAAGDAFDQMGNDAIVAGQKLSQLQTQVSGFGGGVRSFTPISVSSLTALPKAIDNVNKSLSKTPQASNAATLSMINLGRVVQDAPFGFLGIANNLNPLIESFQRTGAAAGGFKGAMGALGKSLVGAGGISLAVSAISTGLILFGDKLFGTGKKAKQAEDELKKLADSVTNSAVKLTSLVGLVQNVNASFDDKQKALRAINQEYKTYIDNLGIEEVTLGNISTAYDKIIDSMLRQAVVKGLQNEIAKAIEETAKQMIGLGIEQQRFNDSQKEAIQGQTDFFTGQKKVEVAAKDTVDAYEGVADAISKSQQPIKDGSIALAANANQFRGTTAAGRDYEGLMQRLKDELKKTIAPALTLANSFADLDIGLNKLKSGSGKVAPKIDFDDSLIGGKQSLLEGFSERFADLPGLIQKFIDGPLVQSVKTADFSKAGETVNLQLFNSFLKQFEAIGAEIPDIDVTISPVINEQKLSRALKFAEKAREQAEQFAGIISNAFTDFFDTIIEGGNAFQALGNIVKSVIAQIIQDLIKAAITALLFRALLPGGGAGVGGLGSLIGSLGRRQAGGPVAQSRAFLVGETGPEIFVPSTSGKIIPNNGLRSITGQARQAIDIGGELKLRGRDMVLLVARQNRYNLNNT